MFFFCKDNQCKNRNPQVTITLSDLLFKTKELTGECYLKIESGWQLGENTSEHRAGGMAG